MDGFLTLPNILTMLFNTFMPELLIGSLLFSGKLKKRRGFYVRLIAGGACVWLLSLFLFSCFYFLGIWYLSNILIYLLSFGMLVSLLAFLYEEPLPVLLLCGSCGYAAQHIAAQVVMLLVRPFLSVSAGASPRTLLMNLLVSMPVIGLVYLFVYRFYARKAEVLVLRGGADRRLINLSLFTILIVAVLSGARDTFAGESALLANISRLFSIFMCNMLLYLRSYILEQERAESENAMLAQLIYEQQKQFGISSETIDLINQKCHDMRHQIESGSGSSSHEELKQLINIYDSMLRTGNATLDVVLAEKSIFCEKHGIRLSPIIDGSAISFMKEGDICALFGNILENAIEAVLELPEEEDRIISFRVQRRGQMVVILSENYYVGERVLVDGLPSSTKGDDRFHGFGMKSIRRIAQSYGGEVTVEIDDMFHLTVLLPVAAEIEKR